MFNRKLEYFIPSINDGTNKTHGIEDSSWQRPLNSNSLYIVGKEIGMTA